jgi:hypothetical protein
MVGFRGGLAVGLWYVLSSVVYAALPEDFQSLSAQQKQSMVWEEIQSSHTGEPFPPLAGTSFTEVLAALRGLFDLSPTFDYQSDELPHGRRKILHPNGSIAKIAWVPAPNHPFTGIYQTGGIGVARLSLATAPTDESYIPGMAIKLFVSQNPSLHLHVMNRLEGQQSDWNFFAKEFSNRIDHPKGWVLQAIEKIFEWTRDPANELPLWHLAAWTSESRSDGVPIFPDRIFFKPAGNVTELIPADSREDFRRALLTVPLGPIYEVYGNYEDREYHIGTIVLESELLASRYGDETLFFQHHR